MRPKLAGLASQLCEVFNVQLMLDYRCGGDPIIKHMAVGHAMKIQLYEPKFERFADPPLPAEFVFYCADDNIEDELSIESLMRTLSALSGKACIIGIPKARIDRTTWLTQAMRFFQISTYQVWEEGFFIVGYPLEETIQLVS